MLQNPPRISVACGAPQRAGSGSFGCAALDALHHGLTNGASIHDVVICGITTNHCCETTARMAGNLGYKVSFVIDATRTFDRVGPDGRIFTAAELAAVTAANLDGEFASVVTTVEALELH